jgi:uncharacterized protein (DUF362 family)/Pyruvate/2-oxoacid:ferredoxin oxidoreductase delta subunit
MHRVLIEPSDYDRCREAVDKAFDLFPLDMKDKKVLIKPNALRAGTPDQAVTTHPAVIRAVVDRVEASGAADIVVGDNPGIIGYGANRHTFEVTGLMDAAKGHYQNIGQDSVEKAFCHAGLERVSVSRAVVDADLIVSVPKFKTHGLTVITGAIKNSYGLLPGAQKATLHRLAGTPHRFHELIVEVFKLRVPDLIIMDGVVGMEGNGPASKDLRDDVGVILASDNAVALDAVVARMMGLSPGRLRFLTKAREEGLGDWSDAAIEVVGLLKVLPHFALPPLGGEANIHDENVQNLLASKANLAPRVDPDSCTACGTCVEQCPVGALSLPENLPEVDVGLCITCFCCQEMCPEQAIQLQ